MKQITIILYILKSALSCTAPYERDCKLSSVILEKNETYSIIIRFESNPDEHSQQDWWWYKVHVQIKQMGTGSCAITKVW